MKKSFLKETFFFSFEDITLICNIKSKDIIDPSQLYNQFLIIDNFDNRYSHRDKL